MTITPPIHTPNPNEVRQIAALKDPVLRNLQITQCYSELSRRFSERTGRVANWCTFATWASKQAGQTIRKEDLKQFLRDRLSQDEAAQLTASEFAATSDPDGAQLTADLGSFIKDLRSFETPTQRASQAVGRGNQKVFEEIGFEFARFIESCFADLQSDPAHLQEFCSGLRPGDPPDGQEYLRQAFSHYYKAMFTDDAGMRAELVFMANLKIGYHEQNRLQPEIAAALDAGFNSLKFLWQLLTSLYPNRGLAATLWQLARRLLGRPRAFTRSSRALVASIQSFLRETITELMMTITLPSGPVRLGRDLSVGFAPSLQVLTLPALQELLAKLDPTPDSVIGSGARDWAVLADRLHFIIDLFRCYQENSELFAPPFD